MPQWLKQIDGYLDEAEVGIPTERRRLLLFGVLVLLLILRLLTLSSPALDRTCWKEIDYLAVSHNFWQHGYHFFFPEVSWPAEPPRQTAMELPLAPFLAALLYPIFGFVPLAARLPTVLASLLMSAYVYRLGRASFGWLVGLGAALSAGLLFLSHPFGRFLFSDPLVIALSVVAVFHYDRFLKGGRRRDGALFSAALALCLLVKLEALYLGPLFAALTVYHRRARLRGYAVPLGLGALCLVPAALWYAHAVEIGRTALDVFGVTGGLHGGGHNKFQTLTLLRQVSWYREMYGRIGHVLLGGPLGMGLFGLGVVVAARLRRGGLFFAYLATIGIYFAVVAEGQIDAPYRQLALLPAAAPFLALGAMALTILGQRLLPTAAVLPLLLLLCVLPSTRGLGRVLHADPRKPFNEARFRLARALRAHAGPEGKLIALGEYSIHVGGNDLSPMLYHYSGLTGWTLERGQWSMAVVQDRIQRGATHLLAFQMEREPDAAPFLAELRRRYPVRYENEDGFILDLR
jgi:4-amino-4-deoxy-L-arabinose transferase-like glycosyltransferase